MKKILCIALVCVIAVAALAGCGGGSKPEDVVVGKWDVVDNTKGMVFEFREDSSYSITDKDGNSDDYVSGTYEVKSDKVVTYDEDGKKMDEFTIDGDEMKVMDTGELFLRKQ